MDSKSKSMSGDSNFLSFKNERTLRIGLIPRKENVHWKEVYWFDTKSPLAVFHLLNAWEDGEAARFLN